MSKLICPHCNCDKIFKFTFNECHRKGYTGSLMQDSDGYAVPMGRFQCVKCGFRGVADKFIK